MVSRAPVVVREASAWDTATVASLWCELRQDGSPLGPLAPPAREGAVQDQLARLSADPAHRVVVAEVGDEPVGIAVLSLLPVAPLSDEMSVQISYLHVRDDRRKRGVGHAIVAAAVEFAAERSADLVTVGVFPSARETNRFFARLGFKPLVVRRVASVASLQRRLGRVGQPRADLVSRRLRRGRTLARAASGT